MPHNNVFISLERRLPIPLIKKENSIDGAYNENSDEGATGVVIRDNSGEVTLTAWRYLQSGGSVEEAEAIIARKDDLTLAVDWCAQQVVLEFDCSTIVAMLQVKSGGRTALKFIIDEAVEVGERLPRWTTVHKRGESDSVAHEPA